MLQQPAGVQPCHVGLEVFGVRSEMYCLVVIDCTPTAELIIIIKNRFLNSKDVPSIVKIWHPHFHSNGVTGEANEGQ